MKFFIDFQCQNITKRYSENRGIPYLVMKNLSASRALRQAPDTWPISAHFTTLAIFPKSNLEPPNQILDLLLISVIEFSA